MTVWIDNSVLVPVQRLAHWLQRLTKRTCYWWASQCAFATAGLLFFTTRGWAARIVLALLWVVVGLFNLPLERRFWANPTVLPTDDSYSVVARFIRVTMFGMSTTMLLLHLMLPVDLRVVLDAASNVAIVGYWYLRAVVPLPPGTQFNRARRTLIPVVVKEGA